VTVDAESALGLARLRRILQRQVREWVEEPLDAGHALVVSAAHPHVWSLFTVGTGEVSATAIPYRPGAWTVVRGRSHAHC